VGVSYATMRFSTHWIKLLQWERHSEPVDPGIIALTASFYAGPMMYVMCHTPLTLLLYYVNQLHVSSTLGGESLESIAGVTLFLHQSHS
ncbi:hypothetical protein As57867_006877, partial [Aphanomyces stellatus]